jgi:hypothetical protein
MRNLVQACAIAAALMILSACGNRPVINHAIGPGDARPIEHWQIEWVDTETSQILFPGSTVELTRNVEDTLEVNARDYVRQVRRRLIDRHNISFATNFSTFGRIEITMRGTKLARHANRQDDDPLKRELDRDLQLPAHDPRYRDIRDSITIIDALPGFLFTSPDWVTQVDVSVFDARGLLAHRIEIAAEGEKGLSPDLVADKIAEILTEDRNRLRLTP